MAKTPPSQPKPLCRKCGGKAWEYRKEAREKNGKIVTETVQYPCSRCGGTGWER